MSETELEIQLGLSMAQLDADAWNALVIGESPFVQHGFLLALEQSGSVGHDTGWNPCHLVVYRHEAGTRRLIAAMPLYLKHHSYGEYVFDWAWAEAWQRNGLAYYPKLVTAIPFTPSQSPRLLMADAALGPALMPAVLKAISAYAGKREASSWHILFPDSVSAGALDSVGLIRREDCQYHWHNRGFDSFEGFLALCNARKRKNMRKERSDVAAQGFVFEHLRAEQLTPQVWDRFYLFYQNTYQLRGRQGYLSREFFSRLQAALPQQIVLVMVRHPHHADYVAGALFLKDKRTLYGRYWGCVQDHDNLHFETCYYQGIDICIAEGLQRFDAGAQGEHKLRRGFEPTLTCSYHWIQQPQFAEAVRDFCHQESMHVRDYLEQAAEQLPFRKHP